MTETNRPTTDAELTLNPGEFTPAIMSDLIDGDFAIGLDQDRDVYIVLGHHSAPETFSSGRYHVEMTDLPDADPVEDTETGRGLLRHGPMPTDTATLILDNNENSVLRYLADRGYQTTYDDAANCHRVVDHAV